MEELLNNVQMYETGEPKMNKTIEPKIEQVKTSIQPSAEDCYNSFPGSSCKAVKVDAGSVEALANKDSVKG